MYRILYKACADKAFKYLLLSSIHSNIFESSFHLKEFGIIFNIKETREDGLVDPFPSFFRDSCFMVTLIHGVFPSLILFLYPHP